MRLMYHNFGVVRENKELIRHRMFMTKIKDGCEEEYKEASRWTDRTERRFSGSGSGQ